MYGVPPPYVTHTIRNYFNLYSCKVSYCYNNFTFWAKKGTYVAIDMAFVIAFQDQTIRAEKQIALR